MFSITKIIDFINYLKISYYRGYYLAHRDIFNEIIYEIEGVDIDDPHCIF